MPSHHVNVCTADTLQYLFQQLESIIVIDMLLILYLRTNAWKRAHQTLKSGTIINTSLGKKLHD